MIRCCLIACLVCGALSGCGDGSAPQSNAGTAQRVFYHNNREHQKWVQNPSRTPKMRNPNTGGPMFY